MKKFIQIYTKSDKLLHILAGLIIGLLAAWWTMWIVNRQHWASTFLWIPGFQIVLGAVFWAVVIGLAKEIIWDNWLGKGTPEANDAWATIIGGFIGGLMFWAFVMINGMVYKAPKGQSNQEILQQIEYRYQHMHDNDPASFDNDSKDLKARSDSLLKIMYEKSKEDTIKN